MKQRRGMAFLLSLALLLGGLGAGVPAAYAETEAVVYQSVLTVNGPADQVYGPGDTVLLNLTVKSKSGESRQLKGYDNTITIDTTKFEVVKAEASAAVTAGTTINTNFRPGTEDEQKIKWLYVGSSAAATGTEGLLMGTIQLRVRPDMAATSDTQIRIRQTAQVYEADGSWVNTVEAVSAKLTLEDGKPAYHFGIELTGESGGTAPEDYAPGETLRAGVYLTSGAVSVEAAAAGTTLVYDAADFALGSVQPASGVTIHAVGAGQVRFDYTGTAAGGKLELGSVQLRVRDGAATGETNLSQTDAKVTISQALGQASKIKREAKAVTIVYRNLCTFELVPREDVSYYTQGQTVIFDLVAHAEEAFQPRLLSGQLLFDNEVFEWVEAQAAAGSMTANEKSSGTAVWVSQPSAGGQTGRITLGSITLKAKENAKTGTTKLTQEQVYVEDQSGVLFDGVTGLSHTLAVRAAGTKVYKLALAVNDPAMGNVTGVEGEYEAKEEIPLEAKANYGCWLERWESEGGGIFDPAEEEKTTFIMPGKNTTVTAVFAAGEEINGTVKISGSALGDVLEANVEGIEPEGAKEGLSYQWYRTEPKGSQEAVAGAAGTTYAALENDLDCKISVTVTASGKYFGSLSSRAVTIQEPGSGVTVSGYIGALPGANGGTAVSGVRGAVVTVADGLESETDESGFFTIEGVTSGDYEVRVGGTGIVTRTIELTVGGDDVELGSQAGMVGVLRGDFNGDDDINLSDLTEFMKTYKKNKETEGYSPVGDYNYDDDISLEDLTVFMQHYKKDKSYYDTWSY